MQRPRSTKRCKKDEKHVFRKVTWTSLKNAMQMRWKSKLKRLCTTHNSTRYNNDELHDKSHLRHPTTKNAM